MNNIKYYLELTVFSIAIFTITGLQFEKRQNALMHYGFPCNRVQGYKYSCIPSARYSLLPKRLDQYSQCITSQCHFVQFFLLVLQSYYSRCALQAAVFLSLVCAKRGKAGSFRARLIFRTVVLPVRRRKKRQRKVAR